MTSYFAGKSKDRIRSSYLREKQIKADQKFSSWKKSSHSELKVHQMYHDLLWWYQFSRQNKQQKIFRSVRFLNTNSRPPFSDDTGLQDYVVTQGNERCKWGLSQLLHLLYVPAATCFWQPLTSWKLIWHYGWHWLANSVLTPKPNLNLPLMCYLQTSYPSPDYSKKKQKKWHVL